MRAGQKVTCGRCSRPNVVLVSRVIQGKRRVVMGDHFQPNEEKWCTQSGKVVE